MEGQIEGLQIGGNDIGLWNYKKAVDIRVIQRHYSPNSHTHRPI